MRWAAPIEAVGAQRPRPGDRLVSPPLDLRHPGQPARPSPTRWAGWRSSYVYDLAKQPLRIESIDAGAAATVPRRAGQRRREPRQQGRAHPARLRRRCNRPIRLWARDDARRSHPARAPRSTATARDAGLSVQRRPGRATCSASPTSHYDEAGLVTVEAYDFKGNVLEKTRQVIGDAPILAVFEPAAAERLAGAGLPGRLAARTGRTTRTRMTRTARHRPLPDSPAYDALNRVKVMTYPAGRGRRRATSCTRTTTAPGRSKQVDGSTATTLRRADRLQRQGPAVADRLRQRGDDPLRLRPADLSPGPAAHRALSASPPPLTYHPTGAPLQDFAYGYDLVGNILRSATARRAAAFPARLQGAGRPRPAFTYDPLYRLAQPPAANATCRRSWPPWDDQPRCTDLTLTRALYRDLHLRSCRQPHRLKHQANSGGFTRDFTWLPATTASQP